MLLTSGHLSLRTATAQLKLLALQHRSDPEGVVLVQVVTAVGDQEFQGLRAREIHVA
jgi:hypothetical protein